MLARVPVVVLLALREGDLWVARHLAVEPGSATLLCADAEEVDNILRVPRRTVHRAKVKGRVSQRNRRMRRGSLRGMCGIVGALGGGLPRTLGAEGGQRALDALARRGPDGSGSWGDADAGVWIGHARLAIIDRSSAGAQPMRSASGRWVIALNGEIYNHRELRARVDGGAVVGGGARSWRGHADTESLVEHIDAFGVEATLSRVEGMFAFAAWDAHERMLHLARDPFGQKPMYWGWVGGGAWARGETVRAGAVGGASLVFASSLAAIEAMPGFERRVNAAAVAALMRWQCVPGELCIYHGLQKLAPGHWLRVSAGEEPTLRRWWSLGDVIVSGESERRAPLHTEAARADALSRATTAVREAVRSQLESDVPLGVLLSGGIDSSLVLALAQEHAQECSAAPVHAFTVGFGSGAEDVRTHDESAAAEAVARALGVRHHVLHATDAKALAVVPSLASIYDEPFADSSQVPTAIAARLARQHVGVALTGDGGDEMFGGYRRHRVFAQVWPMMAWMPMWMRAWCARRMHRAADRAVSGIRRAPREQAQGLGRAALLRRMARIMSADSMVDAHWSLASSWTDEWPIAAGGAVEVGGRGVAGAPRPGAPDLSGEPWWRGLSDVERSIALDTLHYLSDDILVKVDRAAMFVGLETRAPMLDTRVATAAWR
ncbi:MAG: asparagine synthase (glutamine-hydrolyzing), partial [Phycisphaerales bacterium]|nr:asparagine synthase (glutamine-hydrolyzing) [Phycisphaerales bacterium]